MDAVIAFVGLSLILFYLMRREQKRIEARSLSKIVVRITADTSGFADALKDLGAAMRDVEEVVRRFHVTMEAQQDVLKELEKHD